MKKIILFLIAFLFIGFFAEAQRFGWGFNGGLSMSTVGGAYPNGDKITNAELIPGFYLGLHFKYRPRRFISLSTGFNYVSKGANIDSNSEITQMGVNAAKLRSEPS